MPTTLSRRGLRAVNQPLRADLELFFAAMQDQYDAGTNPTGKFLLCVAENLLETERMAAKLREVATRPIPPWVPGYTAILGAPPLREAAAAFLGHLLHLPALDPARLAVAAGAAAVIEMTALLLGDPGDVVVIPGPAYMAYTPDVANKAELERYDLHPASAPGSAARYRLTTADLDRARAELGDRFRILLLTQPNNPTGQVFTATQLTDFADWCVGHRIHLVVNEIYAFSRFDQEHPDLREMFPAPVPFHSFLHVLEAKRSPYLHWWYAVSKDFGLSGLRVGFAYTHHDELLQAWGNYGATSMCSNHTQWLLTEVLSDLAWTEDFLARSQAALTASYAAVIRLLRRHGIPFAPAVGSLFVWCDLSAFLAADTADGERMLWRRIYDETGILLTAPDGMGSPERGWFRIVYSGLPLPDLEVALARLDRWLSRA